MESKSKILLILKLLKIKITNSLMVDALLIILLKSRTPVTYKKVSQRTSIKLNMAIKKTKI